MYERDTIAAIATAPGRGGIGIVRVSGPQASSIARQVFRSRQSPERWESHRLYFGEFLDQHGRVIDRGLAVLMRAPHSYTGEDVLELHAHGSPIVLQHLLTHALVAGARHAEPGEFTRRAFLNGRLDLAQAEAVADLVEARTLGSAIVAARQLGGQLSRTLESLREQLVQALALLEAQIDFGDEIELPVEETLAPLCQIRDELVRLRASYREGALLRQGATVALVGRPNVGKSSLLNALLGAERAIVTEFAGTTRDTLQEVWDCDGIPTILTDTAGLRPESATDPVERIGIQRTKGVIDRADVCVLVLDRSEPLQAEDFHAWEQVKSRSVVIALNKSDLPALLEVESLPFPIPPQDVVPVSARTGAGLSEFRAAVARRLRAGSAAIGDDLVLSHPRHVAAVERALDALDRVERGVAAHVPLDIISFELRTGVDALGSITGAVGAEDVLDDLFRRFCIGK